MRRAGISNLTQTGSSRHSKGRNSGQEYHIVHTEL
jgi:hypothetical protein